MHGFAPEPGDRLTGRPDRDISNDGERNPLISRLHFLRNFRAAAKTA